MEQPSRTGAMGGGPMSVAGQPGRLSDADIVGITDTAHRGEIEQAQLALERSSDPGVRAFAQRMIEDHGHALERQSALVSRLGLPLSHGTFSQRWSSQSQQILDTLRAQQGDAFDRAYIDAQVRQHRQLLDMLDNQLIPNATQPQLRAQIEELRPVIASHLAQAQRIQARLSSSPTVQ